MKFKLLEIHEADAFHQFSDKLVGKVFEGEVDLTRDNDWVGLECVNAEDVPHPYDGQQVTPGQWFSFYAVKVEEVTE